MKRSFKRTKSVLALLLAVTFLFFGTASSGSTGGGSSDNGSSENSGTVTFPFPFPGIMPLDDWDCDNYI